METSTKVPMPCDICSKTIQVKPLKTGEPRLPQSWKRFKNQVYCDKCWGASYKLRALTIPVRRLTKEHWDLLRKCWNDARAVANVSVQALAKDDIVRTPDMEKLGKPPKTYLYPLGRQVAPEMTPASVVALQHAVQSRYNKSRWDIIWTGEASFPNYRRVPYPVPADAFEIEKHPDGWYLVHVRLRGERITFQLAAGANFRRHLAGIDKILLGEAKQVELSLLAKRSNPGDHRSGGEMRQNGNKYRWEVMCKVVAWLPRTEDKDKLGTLEAMTGPNFFLRVMHASWEEPKYIQADHVKTWIVGHEQSLKRIRERPQNKKFKQAEYDRRTMKQGNRLDSFIKMAAAQLRRWLSQTNSSTLRYDDSCKEYFQFPWKKQEDQIKLICDDVGVIYEKVASGEVVDKTPGTAREEQV